MNGYILYRGPDGQVLRVDADRPSRKSLVRELEDRVPGEAVTLGIVLIPAARARLHLVETAA